MSLLTVTYNRQRHKMINNQSGKFPTGYLRITANDMACRLVCRNGRIVGAVTHVLVNDPTTGYSIFIKNRLVATT